MCQLYPSVTSVLADPVITTIQHIYHDIETRSDLCHCTYQWRRFLLSHPTTLGNLPHRACSKARRMRFEGFLPWNAPSFYHSCLSLPLLLQLALVLFFSWILYILALSSSSWSGIISSSQWLLHRSRISFVRKTALFSSKTRTFEWVGALTNRLNYVFYWLLHRIVQPYRILITRMEKSSFEIRGPFLKSNVSKLGAYRHNQHSAKPLVPYSSEGIRRLCRGSRRSSVLRRCKDVGFYLLPFWGWCCACASVAVMLSSFAQDIQQSSI